MQKYNPQTLVGEPTLSPSPGALAYNITLIYIQQFSIVTTKSYIVIHTNSTFFKSVERSRSRILPLKIEDIA